MYNSIMRIESVVGSFWMALSAYIRTFTNHLTKYSQILFSIKKVSHTFLIRMLKTGALELLSFSRYSKNIQVHYILASIVVL